MEQIAHDVIGQFAGALVAPVAILFDRLHHDPVQVASEGPLEGGRPVDRRVRATVSPCSPRASGPGPRAWAAPPHG